MSSPRVSVVIPTYESARFARDAIDSVLGQSFTEVEILVVDDGSREDVRAVLGDRAQRVRLLRQDNGGPSRARNTGIRNAVGDYVAFLDADDVWLPHKLEHQVTFLDHHPEVGMVFGDAQIVADQDVVLESFFDAKEHGPELLAGGTLPNAFGKLMSENFAPTSSVMVRRRCFEEVGYFDEDLRSVEDREMWLRVAQRFAVACLPELVVRKRSHDANLSSDTALARRSRIQVLKKLVQHFPTTVADCGFDLPGELATLHWELGYQHLQRSETAQARRAFRESLRHRFRWRTLAHAWLAALGPRAVRTIRRLRRR